LSTTSTKGPVVASLGVRPSNGSASARISSAAANNRSSNSHQGVAAGVCSSSSNPRSRRSGGNSVRRGKGGVTRNNHHRSGRTAKAARMMGVPKLICERRDITFISRIAQAQAQPFNCRR
jgi:hypothetical protein